MKKQLETENVIVAPQIGGYQIMFKEVDGWYSLLLKGRDAALFEALWHLLSKVFPQRSKETIVYEFLDFGVGTPERIM